MSVCLGGKGSPDRASGELQCNGAGRRHRSSIRAHVVDSCTCQAEHLPTLATERDSLLASRHCHASPEEKRCPAPSCITFFFFVTSCHWRQVHSTAFCGYSALSRCYDCYAQLESFSMPMTTASKPCSPRLPTVQENGWFPKCLDAANEQIHPWLAAMGIRAGLRKDNSSGVIAQDPDMELCGLFLLTVLISLYAAFGRSCCSSLCCPVCGVFRASQAC